jgi:predicted PurR-regulated permease PerM
MGAASGPAHRLHERIAVSLSMAKEQTARRFFLGLLAAVAILLALVIRPLASSLIMAVVLAGVLSPLHRRLTNRLRGRRGLAAGALVLGLVVLLLGPAVMLGTFLVREGVDAVRLVARIARSEGIPALVDKLPEPLAKVAHAFVDRVAESEESVAAQLGAHGGQAAATLYGALSAAGSLLFGLVIMLIALYFLLAQADELIGWLDAASPLRPGQTRELLVQVKRVSFSVVVATVATAAVQSVVALLGYVIARLPNAVFFAAVTFVMALIPALGAATACVAASGILFVTGHAYAGLFLAAWGLFVVGLVDNVIKPLLMRAGMEMRGALVFFALMGGLGAFGPIGLVVGPLVVAVFLTLVRMWTRDFAPGALVEPAPRESAA